VEVVLCCVEALELTVDNVDGAAEGDVFGVDEVEDKVEDKDEDKVEECAVEVVDGVLLVGYTKSQQEVRGKLGGNVPQAGLKWISTEGSWLTQQQHRR